MKEEGKRSFTIIVNEKEWNEKVQKIDADSQDAQENGFNDIKNVKQRLIEAMQAKGMITFLLKLKQPQSINLQYIYNGTSGVGHVSYPKGVEGSRKKIQIFSDGTYKRTD